MKSIVKFAFSSCLSICALGFSVTSAAQTSDSLKTLYQQVSKEVSAEAAHNSEREQRFRAAASDQKALLAEVQADLVRQEKLRDEMKVVFDANEVQLGELTTQLDRRTGNLGELFGVFRQMAGDTLQVLFD